jgi:(R,R)-butanediol dehydrogenase / meso-butanediol dehydrogenase / diacetyl reductase
VQAVRLVAAHEMQVVDLPDPEPGAGDVVLRVDGCGICGSDLSSYKVGLFTDTVPGHELSGTITAVGDGVSGWKPGDVAVVDPKTPCGFCDDCRAGQPHRCAMALTSGIGFARPGGFAELVLSPAPLLHAVPDRVAVQDACIVEPLSVAIHGIERAVMPPGAHAIVIGLGPIGLFTVAALHARGVDTVVGVDPVDDRRRIALELGASNTVAALDEVRGVVQPAYAVFECSGHVDLLQAASDLVAPGGKLILVGVPFGQANVAPLMWVTREIDVIGSIASTEDDFAASIQLLSQRPEIASTVITGRVPLAEVDAAFAELIAPTRGGKVVVDPRL